jgi:signal transduction histidine kinase
MRRIKIITITLLLAGLFPAISVFAKPESSLKTESLSGLEQRLAEMDAELERLARYSLRSGLGSIGFRSARHKKSQPEWVEIDLGQETQLDEIVLIPIIRRDSQEKYNSIDFPIALRIIAGSATNRTGTVVAEYGPDDPILPRIAPVRLPAHGITASWVRIEATQLSKDPFSKWYLLQLAEVMIFSGERNVALRQPVETSSTASSDGSAHHKRYLVDGHSPFVMHSSQGQHSIGHISPRQIAPTLTLDLGEPVPLSGIHLHALDESDTVPQPLSSDRGLPNHLLIEGASRSNFSDVITLVDFKKRGVFNTGPIMMWNLPETNCRYVRITEAKPNAKSRFGFAEIELFSQGRNVALGKLVSIEDPLNRNLWRVPSLTDGRNRYGNILPVREWMRQLARRHDLENARPLVAAELTRRYARQKVNLMRMYWLATLLAAGGIIGLLIEKVIRQRILFRARERIAANLHDELGANLHAIGLLGDFAKRVVDRKNARAEWAELNEIVTDIRALTEETGSTARYCTNMLEAEGLYQNVGEEMKRVSDRLLADLEHDLSVPDDEGLSRLKPRRRIDLLLFYKECLTNIIRHSGATAVMTQLSSGEREICLTVTDNGCGHLTEVPPSLKRRARLLGAKVARTTPASGGTKITLTLRLHRRKFRTRNSKYET